MTSIDRSKMQTHSFDYRIRKTARISLTYVLMLILAVFFLFPIVFMLVSSVKNSEMQVIGDMGSLKAFLPIGDIGIQNFRDVFANLDFGHLMFNSVLVMLLTVILGLFINRISGNIRGTQTTAMAEKY